jgi:hypothetical protein
MKRKSKIARVGGVSAALLALCMLTAPLAQAQAANANQVALLKWYVNQTTSFPVGTQPFGVAFDGANIWVANDLSNSVTKISANDGTPLGTFSVGPGAFPARIAFDGADIWVTNTGGNYVSKLRASDGAPLGNFKDGAFPYGIVFDGSNMWVTNVNSNNVTKYRASDGKVLGTFTVGATNLRILLITMLNPPLEIKYKCGGENWFSVGRPTSNHQPSDCRRNVGLVHFS